MCLTLGEATFGICLLYKVLLIYTHVWEKYKEGKWELLTGKYSQRLDVLKWSIVWQDLRLYNYKYGFNFLQSPK